VSKLLPKIFRVYYALKFFPFRKERRANRAHGSQRGFVGIQIDGLAHPHLQIALKEGYLPRISKLLQRGHRLHSYQAGLPSTTPAAQSAIFYGDTSGIPAFRWYDKQHQQLISCNDPDHVQIFREDLFANRPGVLDGGSSYSNILDGGASRSVFTVSSPHPQTLFGRFGGWRLQLLILLHPFRVSRMIFASIIEYFANIVDRWHYRHTRPWRLNEGLFPLIRIICNVILREFQTFGVIADIYSGVPYIYTTYSGYDELAHHFGPTSRAALKNLKYTDIRIGEIMRMLRYAPGIDYEIVILSDHGQTPGYPFHDRFGATLGDTINAFLRESSHLTVSSGPLEMTQLQLDYLGEELRGKHNSWRQRSYRRWKKFVMRHIKDLVPETHSVDPHGGVIITYSSTLAHLYLTDYPGRMNSQELEAEQPLLLDFLCNHKGIGFIVMAGKDDEVVLKHQDETLIYRPGMEDTTAPDSFIRAYGEPTEMLPMIYRFAQSELCGDLIIFGAYDGKRIACFEDQVGGQGSVGWDKLEPFLFLPGGHALFV
jgi:hypothetical protein